MVAFCSWQRPYFLTLEEKEEKEEKEAKEEADVKPHLPGACQGLIDESNRTLKKGEEKWMEPEKICCEMPMVCYCHYHCVP